VWSLAANYVYEFECMVENQSIDKTIVRFIAVIEKKRKDIRQEVKQT